MAKAKIGAGYVEWDGKQIPLLCGEFHYWRNEPAHWPLILKRLKQVGFTVVTSFVQWNVHETAAGVFDFEGTTAPQRDLPRFLKDAQEAGLYVHLRPGPACCEWRNSGGTSFGTPWRQCYEAYWRVVEPHTVNHGGSLLLQQIHNEWFDPIGSYDILACMLRDFDGYHATEVPHWLELCGPNCHYLSSGYDFDLGFLTRFLKFRYGTLDRFQAAWGGEYETFERPVQELRAYNVSNPHQLFLHLTKLHEDAVFPGMRIRRLFDILDWFRCYTAIPLADDMDHARNLGCDLPLSHNWAMMETGDWDRLAHTDLSGYDHYMPVKVHVWDWIFITADFHGSRFPFVGEFMTGAIERYMWGGQGITDEKWERFSKIAFLANGARGMNLYMFVERDNWLQCPLDERGGLRPSYESFQRLFTSLNREEWHLRSMAHDVGIVKYLPYHQARTDVHETHFDRGYNLPWIRTNIYGDRDPKREFYRLFKSLHGAGIDFINHKCPHEVTDLPHERVLVCYGLRFMGRDLAEALVRHVQEGGGLLLYPELPEMDLDGKAMDVLTAAFGLNSPGAEEAESVTGEGGTYTFPEKQELRTIDPAGGVALLDTPDGSPCAVLKTVGKGRVLFAGVEIGASVDLTDYLVHRCLGARKFAATDAPESGASIAVHPQREPLLVVYNGNKKAPVQEVKIDASALPEAGTLYLEDLVTQAPLVEFARPSLGAAVVKIDVAPRDATIFRISAKRPAAAAVSAKGEVHRLTQAQHQSEEFGYYINRYAAGEAFKSWPLVDGRDWTLSAIANGNTFGVQGWFWLTRTVQIPAARERVFLRIIPRGWHNIIVAYANGVEAGRACVERPGGAMEYDITALVKPGGGNVIALRVFRQSLDCHDKGASGFDRVEVAAGAWSTEVTHWHLAQERLDRGETEGWHEGSGGQDWRPVEFPHAAELPRGASVEWLRFPFEARATRGCRIRLAGNNLAAQVWLNGTYIAKTPYLPVELPAETGLRAGENVLVMRIVPDPFATYDAPRENRYQDYILDGLKPLKVELTGVEIG